MESDLPVGAHLVTPRRGYVHHGIYAGNGCVIHYRGFDQRLHRNPVEEVSLEQFAKGRAVQQRSWVAPRFDGHEVVARARSRVGEDQYRLLTNNCEHFVEWCIGGRARSRQVESWITAIGKKVVGLGQVGRRLGVRPKRGLA
jgi:hypothetical protein